MSRAYLISWIVAAESAITVHRRATQTASRSALNAKADLLVRRMRSDTGRTGSRWMLLVLGRATATADLWGITTALPDAVLLT
eukprot:1579348-Rhodomonas_salina.1